MENKYPVNATIDFDYSLGLETNSLPRRLFNFFLVPVLNNLPKGFKHKIKKTNKAAKEVIDNVTNHNALEVLYSKGNIFHTRNLKKKFFQKMYKPMCKGNVKMIIVPKGDHRINKNYEKIILQNI